MKFPLVISDKLAEEVGWHIGDGSMNFYQNRGKRKGLYQLRGHIEDDKEHYIRRIKPLFEELFQVKLKIRKMYSTRVVGFQIWNNELVHFKKNLGLPLGSKFDITIPASFLSKPSLKKAVLRGIFDTDGGVYLEKKNNKIYPRIYITTISFKLSEQLLNLFSEFGLRVTKYSQLYNQRFRRKRSYIITIRGVEMFKQFMEIIKPANPKHRLKYEKFLNS